MSDVLEASIHALRSAGEGDTSDVAALTRTRVRRSLARRARSHRRVVQLSLISAVLVVSTLSWALSTGRLSIPGFSISGFSSRHEEPPAPVIQNPVAMPSPMAKRVARSPVEEVWPAPAPVPAPAPAPLTVAKPKPRPAETLYRKAHELHFHSTDLIATLAAWDAYLAAEPAGRFAVEARYNRALVLAKLHRYREARTALQPFARGEIGGYRAAEAAPLVERLDQLIELNDPAPSGDPGR